MTIFNNAEAFINITLEQMTVSTIYRSLREGEETEAGNLVARSFNEFIAPEFSEEGIEEFFNYVNPRAIFKRSLENHHTIIAEVDCVVVGIIEIREKRHVSMLFVDKQFHRRGIAKGLFRTALERIRSEGSDPEQLTVNSSTYALPFYESLGFVKTSEQRMIYGVLHIPMVLTLTEGNILGNDDTSS